MCQVVAPGLGLSVARCLPPAIVMNTPAAWKWQVRVTTAAVLASRECRARAQWIYAAAPATAAVFHSLIYRFIMVPHHKQVKLTRIRVCCLMRNLGRYTRRRRRRRRSQRRRTQPGLCLPRDIVHPSSLRRSRPGLCLPRDIVHPNSLIV